jgi:hypothetical protein
MSTEGLSMMLVTEISVTLITFYFFVKILKTPNKQEPDSFSENDAD